MKKIIVLLLIILVLSALFIAWKILGPTVHAPEGKYLYIRSNHNMDSLKQTLIQEKILSSTFYFDRVRNISRVNFKNVKPGRYKIEDGSNLIDLIRKLKRGQQEPVRFVINKLRTKEDLASRIGRNFECDSTQAMHYLLNNDSLKKWNLDTNTVMTAVIPNTYLLHWNGSFTQILNRLKYEQEKFWNEERLAQAQQLKLTPVQVYTLASIVEEETNKKEDKGKIASVYLNRYRKGMKLQADPTVKYALRGFDIKRVYHKHLTVASPYNTYYATGLPPGPICTPSPQTIDEVLNSPETPYLFFVAKPTFDGFSNFAKDYNEHMKFARAYQKALDSLMQSKQSK
ncbi:MAG TPA: endolytic transglycosylase MltG [Ferruginibacter sp.]|nr:endolytic transglycosylase MltG [Ferruginibacter sp.]